MRDFNFLMTTRIVFNNDLAKGIQDAREFLGVKKAVIMTDPGVAVLPIMKELKDAMDAIDFPYELYADVKPNPTDVTVTKAAEVLCASDADVVIGFGGGSAIDTASAAALLKTNGGIISDYYGMHKVKVKPLPQIMITTTAGSGAEITQFISITDTVNKTKAQIGSPLCIPPVAVLCPEMLKNSPETVTAEAGFDALAHCVEGYIGRKANPITDAIALKAFGLISQNLLEFVNDPNNKDAASAMILAASMSTMVASNIGTGDGHNIGRAIGGRFDIGHGTTLAVLLPHVLAFNLEEASEKLADCARTMGIDTDGMKDEDAAKQCILAIQRLRDDLKLPDNFKDYGMTIDQESLDSIVENSIKSNQVGASAGSAPRVASRGDFIRICKDTYEGKKIAF